MNNLLQILVSSGASVLAFFLATFAPASKRAARFFYLAKIRAAVQGAVPVTTQFDGAVRAQSGCRLKMGAHCRLGCSVFFETAQNGSITLGSHVRINTGCVIVSYTEVTIGDDCLIGEYVSIRDADHGHYAGDLIRKQDHVSKPINIGSDVWIGRGAVILKGVSIGSGSIVAANSVVTCDVPALTVVAGIPANVIKKREPS
ncbi:MAG: acyltransferase [Candidatus Sedimenticola sp. (ex Thyasira tokunagai)]